MFIGTNQNRKKSSRQNKITPSVMFNTLLLTPCIHEHGISENYNCLSHYNIIVLLSTRAREPCNRTDEVFFLLLLPLKCR